MGITNPSVQNRAPPLSLRSQKDIARQSPQSRLRSRSYSHDNELYRMGLRKNAEGEWAVVDNLPTAGIANAMREITRIKKEQMEEVMWKDGREDTVESVDMADSTAVFEEIRVYMEEAASREGSHINVDEPAEKYLRGVSVMSLGDVLQTIEIKNEFFEEEVAFAMEFEDSIDMRGQSLASIKEEPERRDPAVDMDMERPSLSPSTSMESPSPPIGGSMQKMAHRRNRQNRYGRTPLGDAAEAGNFEEAKQHLTEFPEDIDVPDADGNTPLQCAALNGHPDIVKLLIEYRCALDCKNNDGVSPLLDAVENCHLDVVKLLLDAGVDPHARNHRGEEPIIKIDDEHEDADEIRAALQAAKQAHEAKSRSPPSLSPDRSTEIAEDSPVSATNRNRKHPATFQCTLCPKRYTRAYNLRVHLRTHTDRQPFACTTCGKTFAKLQGRLRHEELHSRESSFVCRGYLKDGRVWGCNRRFEGDDAYWEHLTGHNSLGCIKPLRNEEERLGEPHSEQQRELIASEEQQRFIDKFLEVSPVDQLSFPQVVRTIVPAHLLPLDIRQWGALKRWLAGSWRTQQLMGIIAKVQSIERAHEAGIAHQTIPQAQQTVAAESPVMAKPSLDNITTQMWQASAQVHRLRQLAMQQPNTIRDIEAARAHPSGNWAGLTDDQITQGLHHLRRQQYEQMLAQQRQKDKLRQLQLQQQLQQQQHFQPQAPLAPGAILKSQPHDLDDQNRILMAQTKRGVKPSLIPRPARQLDGHILSSSSTQQGSPNPDKFAKLMSKTRFGSFEEDIESPLFPLNHST